MSFCTEGYINSDCRVCGIEDASLSNCKGKHAEENAEQPENTSICKHHQHDENCGYQSMSVDGEGSSCTYDCRICLIEDLIVALLDAQDIIEENGDKVQAQMDKILVHFAELTEEEQDQLDFSLYRELQVVLDACNNHMLLAEDGTAGTDTNRKTAADITIGNFTYSGADIAIINQMIETNGLALAKDDPIGWTKAPYMVSWDSGNPRRITRLNLYNQNLTGVLDVTGLTELEWLQCYNNSLTGVQASGLTKLKTLDCKRNQLTMLEISGLTNMNNLQFSYNNQLKSIDLSDMSLLTYLNCSDTGLTVLDISANTNLKELLCSKNELTVLNVSALANLERLECYGNQLTTLDISALANLKTLVCNSNQLATLILPANKDKLQTLWATGNSLITLDVSGYTALKTLLGYDNPQLTTLTLTGASSLQEFSFYNTKLTTVDTSGLGSLTSARVTGNPLTSYTTPDGKTISIDPPVGGTVSMNVNGSPESVQLTATYNFAEAYGFIRWENLPGGVASTSSTVKVTVSDDVSVKAIFKRELSLYYGLSIAQQTYTGGAIEPAVSSIDFRGTTYYMGTDYTCTYIKNVDVGTAGVTLTATEDGSLKGSSRRFNFVIVPAAVTISWGEQTTQTTVYTGQPAEIIEPTAALEDGKLFNGEISYSYTGTSSGTGLPVNAGTYKIKASVTGNDNYTTADSEEMTLIISKAAYTGITTADTSGRYGVTKTYDLANLLPEGYVLGTPTVADDNGIFSGSPSVNGTELHYTLADNAGNVNKIGAISVPVTSSSNYDGFVLTITVTVMAKIVPTLTINPISVTYTGSAVLHSAIQGTATAEGKTIPGTWSFVEGQALTNVTDSGTKTVIFTPVDEARDDYASAVGTVRVTISKVTPSLIFTSSPATLPNGGTVMLTLSGLPSGSSVSVTCSNENITVTKGSDNIWMAELPSGGASYTFTAVYAGDENYNSTSADCTIRVEKITPVLKLSAAPDFLLGGGTVMLTLSGLPAGGTATVTCDHGIVVTTGAGNTWMVTLPNSDATYTFTASYVGDDSYHGASASCTVRTENDDPIPPQPTKYSVTVQTEGSGTAFASSISAEVGEKITLTATPNAGYHFKEWQVISGSVTIDDNSFTMPAANVSVKAIFEQSNTPPLPTAYIVTVQAGTGGTASGSGTYAENASVTVTAAANSNYHFVRWIENNKEVSISTSYTFTVKGDRTLVAVFERNSNGGDSSGDEDGNADSEESSSSGGSSTIVERPVQTKPEIPTAGQTKPVIPDADGNVVVDNGAVQSAINAAKDDAKKNGSTAGVAVVIPITPKTDQTSFGVTIKAQDLNLLVQENVKRLEINIDGVIVGGMDAKLLKWLDVASENGDIIFRVKQTTQSGLSEEANNAIGTRPVYDLSLVYLSGGKETRITDFDGHTITVRLPYASEKGEQVGNLYAVYVDSKGKVEWLTRSSYDPDIGAVVFETGHFSIYGIGYKTPVPAFTDIKNHWAVDNIIFAVGRELLSGTGNNQFSPDMGMTRGMFVTALGRLAGIDQNSYKAEKFTDVKVDTYYAPYVNWAMEKGIMNCTTATTFSPDTNITREQMAVIMVNYTKKLGYSLPVTQEAVTFADNAQISGWAAKEVKAMQQMGILAGKSGDRFDPQGIATRAEVATVLRRFIEIIVDPQTAQGWIQNHSGSWQYWKNGKAVIGWLQDGGKWYWLDKNGWMWGGGWKQIDGKWYYFYADGAMAVNTVIDGRQIGPDGAENK